MYHLVRLFTYIWKKCDRWWNLWKSHWIPGLVMTNKMDIENGPFRVDLPLDIRKIWESRIPLDILKIREHRVDIRTMNMSCHATGIRFTNPFHKLWKSTRILNNHMMNATGKFGDMLNRIDSFQQENTGESGWILNFGLRISMGWRMIQELWRAQNSRRSTSYTDIDIA